MLSDDDRAVVYSDPSLTGLCQLLDDVAALKLFQQHLPQLQPTAARCTYLRYKPHVSCLATFDLQTPEGCQYFHAKAFSASEDTKLEKRIHQFSRLATDGTQPTVVEDHFIVLLPFPHDEELPSLELLYDDARLPTLVQRLSRRSFKEIERIHPIRYKPERRFVARLDIHGEPLGVVRIHSDSGYAQSRRSAKSLGRLESVRTPNTIGHSDRHRSLLQEWIPGATLKELMEKGSCTTEFEMVGASLAAIHQEHHRKLHNHPTEAICKSLARLPKDSEFLGLDISQKIANLANCCIGRMLEIDSAPAVTHGDFHPGQVIIDNQRQVAVIDLDNAAIGNPYHDLGTFIAHVQWLALTDAVSRFDLPKHIDSFLAGYRRVRDQVDVCACCAFAAASLLQLVHEPFRHRHRDWRNAVFQILDCVAESLETICTASILRSHQKKRTVPTPAHSRAKSPDLQQACDPRLPQLQDAMDLSTACERVTQVVRDCYRDSSIVLHGARLVRHKPGRRFLVAYKFHKARNESALTVLGKVHHKQRHFQSLELQRNLWDSGFDDHSADGISVARPVGVIPEWNMWLQEHVPGQNGWQGLLGNHGDRVAAQTVDAIGKLSRAGIETHKTHTALDELSILEEKLEEVSQSMPHLERRLRKILACCRALTERMPLDLSCGIHRDFYPDQVIVTGERIFILDHDLYCLGDPCLDVGNFCAHLIEKSLRNEKQAKPFGRATQVIMRQFLSSRNVSTTSLTTAVLVDVYTTLSLARHIFLSTRFPERRYNTIRLMDLCESRLA